MLLIVRRIRKPIDYITTLCGVWVPCMHILFENKTKRKTVIKKIFAMYKFYLLLFTTIYRERDPIRAPLNSAINLGETIETRKSAKIVFSSSAVLSAAAHVCRCIRSIDVSSDFFSLNFKWFKYTTFKDNCVVTSCLLFLFLLCEFLFLLLKITDWRNQFEEKNYSNTDFRKRNFTFVKI